MVEENTGKRLTRASAHQPASARASTLLLRASRRGGGGAAVAAIDPRQQFQHENVVRVFGVAPCAAAKVRPGSTRADVLHKGILRSESLRRNCRPSLKVLAAGGADHCAALAPSHDCEVRNAVAHQDPVP